LFKLVKLSEHIEKNIVSPKPQ